MTGMGSIAGNSDPDNLICPQCGAVLPPNATFCNSCGESTAPGVVEVASIETLPLSAISPALSERAGAPITPGDEMPNIETLPLPAISPEFNEQTEARATPNDEVLDIETLSLPAISAATTEILQAVRLLQSNRRIGRTFLGSPLPPIIETPVPDSVPPGRGSMRPWAMARSLLQRIQHDSLVRNSIYIMATNIATAAFGYIFWVVAAHAYSPNDVGLGAALISVMTLAASLATLGIDSTLVQLLPGRKSGFAWSLTLNAGMATGLLSGLLAGIVTVVALPLFGSQFALLQHYPTYVFALLFGVPIMLVSLLLDQTYVAERAAQHKLIRGLGFAVIKVPLLVLPLLLIGQVGAFGILLPWVVGMAIMLIFGLLVLLPRLGRSYCLATRGIVGQARSMLSLLAGNEFIDLGGIIPYYLLPVFVTARLSATDNAYYYTTLRLAEFFTMGSFAVCMSLFAEGSHASGDLSRKVRSTILVISLITGPLMLFSFFGAHYILLLFGPDYAQHGFVLFIVFVASTVPDAITNVYLTVLRIERRLRFAGMINVAMGALNLGLAWILLPWLGIAGAGWAFLIAQTAGSLVAGVDALHRRYRRSGIKEAAVQSAYSSAETEVSYQQKIE